MFTTHEKASEQTIPHKQFANGAYIPRLPVLYRYTTSKRKVHSDHTMYIEIICCELLHWDRGIIRKREKNVPRGVPWKRDHASFVRVQLQVEVEMQVRHI